MFKWNDKSIKSRFWNAQIGNHEIKQFSAKEIIVSPNYHQPEAIISSCCKILAEMMELKEEEAKRIQSMLGSSKDQMELFEGEKNENETIST